MTFRNLSLIVASFCLVAFGQPAWILAFGPIAAALGYALFWQAMLRWPNPKARFGLATLWFTAVHGVQLSWLTVDVYMGPLIWGFYLFLILVCGLQFGVISYLVSRCGELTIRHSLALAGIWTLFEWSRLFILSGFTWNPSGLALSATVWSLQWASLFGIYGMCFWVFFVNLAGLRALQDRKPKLIASWALLALVPYGYGALQQVFFDRKGESLSAILVQTALRPEQRDYFPDQAASFVHPMDQWWAILSYVEESEVKSPDLIVLPEGVLPFGARRFVYPIEVAKRLWRFAYGETAFKDFPELQEPYAKRLESGWHVSNGFILQALANRKGAQVIAGLDDEEADGKRVFAAAFHFTPERQEPERYIKRILLPIGEYIPLKQFDFVARFVARQFKIFYSFEPGTEAKVFQGRFPIGINVCYEETFGDVVRQVRQIGARILVNITNDVWFPGSKLPKQHFDHGIIRAVENGLPHIRACNTGITGGVDCFGRTLKLYPENVAGSLTLKVPLASFPTLYSIWGDKAILLLSALFALARKKEARLTFL